MSESKRAAIRIAANYVRLFGSVIVGLALVRVLLGAVGQDGWAIIALLTSTMGLATVIEESVENSMVRELGFAHHSGDAARFRGVYNAGLLVSGGASICALLVYGVIFCLIPLLEISESMLSAARWFLAAKALESMSLIALSPAYNMYLATERMLAFNGWLLARRVASLVAAAITLGLGADSPADALIMYGWLSAVLHVGVVALAVLALAIRDSRLWPRPSLADRAALREILRTSGANASMYATRLLEIPLGAVIINQAFGLHGNFVFGIAVQLAAYVRMVAGGLTGGVDAVATRLAASAARDGERSRIQALVYHGTRLQTFVALPAMVGMFVLATPFLQVWLAGKDVTPQALNEASTLTRILVFGFFAQCLLDVWWRMLYGAGFIRRYVQLLVCGAILTPIVTLALLAMLPDSIRIASAAMAFTFIYVGVYLTCMPWIVARSFGVSLGRLLRAMGRPLVPAIVCGAMIMIVDRWIAQPSVWSLGVEMGLFAIVFAGLAYMMVLEPGDRERIIALGRRVRAVPGLARAIDEHEA